MMGGFTIEERERLRKQYEFYEKDILELRLTDVYSLWPHDWMSYFSPIERNFFSWMRDRDMRGFWPQYPCGPYFMDFASPTKKICIELDGKAWHQDYTKDKVREDYIRSQGYRVYRLTGRQSYDLILWDNEETYDENGIETSYEHPLSEYMDKIVRGESE